MEIKWNEMTSYTQHGIAHFGIQNYLNLLYFCAFLLGLVIKHEIKMSNSVNNKVLSVGHVSISLEIFYRTQYRIYMEKILE